MTEIVRNEGRRRKEVRREVLHVSVPPWLVASVDAAAGRRLVSRSAVVREALLATLDAEARDV